MIVSSSTSSFGTIRPHKVRSRLREVAVCAGSKVRMGCRMSVK